ncbi:serine hydrolase [Bradyrhizobium sp. 31Argb]|uniref:serine hydrolase domain-containing protein n=1 Tax=Bradyrhizobium sp. 31Argb TaxID=3141247 RepID=UPI0037489ECC
MLPPYEDHALPDLFQRPRYRDPLNPGAPLLPRSGWSRPPMHRWTFQHIREMTPTAQVWRGPGPVMPLSENRQELGSVAFTFDGRALTFDGFLADTATDGMLVLHRGAIVYERYFNDMKPHSQHLSMSMAKSMVGMVAGILVRRGVLDPAAPVTRYLPELARTAYSGATLQHVLDMTTGVVFDESYTTPGSHMVKLGYACGWRVNDNPDWPRTLWELILTLTEQERPHGSLFQYRSIETDVLGFVLERVTATSLSELVSRELWGPMGAQEDGYFTVDHGGFALADGGFCASLRDYGRFAQLIINGGRHGDRQVIPSSWIEETRNNGNTELFQGFFRETLPVGAYHNKWWIEDPKGRAMLARGIFGQLIYIDPESEYAFVKLSTWPEVTSVPRAREAIAAAHAIRRALCG